MAFNSNTANTLHEQRIEPEIFEMLVEEENLLCACVCALRSREISGI